ncbi:hypothetical protein D3C87_1728990 [compost metagenome]
MFNGFVSQSLLDQRSTFHELCILLSGKLIVNTFVGAYQMRKYARYFHRGVLAKLRQKPFVIIFHETEPVHAGIEFQMHGRSIGRFAFSGNIFDPVGKDAAAVNFGFKFVLPQKVEGR